MGGVEPAGDYVLELLARRQARRHREQAARRAARRRALRGRVRRRACSCASRRRVCAAIPVIKVLRESLVVTNVHRVLGIVNGTTNFILTRDGARRRRTTRRSPRRSGSATRRPTRPTTSAAPTPRRRWRSSRRSRSARASTLDDVDVRGHRARSTPAHVAAARELDMVVRLVGARDARRRRASTCASSRRSSTRHHPLAAVDGRVQRRDAAGRRDPRDHARRARAPAGSRRRPPSSPTWSASSARRAPASCRTTPVWRELERLPPGDARARRSTSASTVDDRPGVLARVAQRARRATRSRSRGSCSSPRTAHGARSHVVTHEAPAGRVEAALAAIRALPEARGEATALPGRLRARRRGARLGVTMPPRSSASATGCR